MGVSLRDKQVPSMARTWDLMPPAKEEKEEEERRKGERKKGGKEGEEELHLSHIQRGRSRLSHEDTTRESLSSCTYRMDLSFQITGI